MMDEMLTQEMIKRFRAMAYEHYLQHSGPALRARAPIYRTLIARHGLSAVRSRAAEFAQIFGRIEQEVINELMLEALDA